MNVRDYMKSGMYDVAGKLREYNRWRRGQGKYAWSADPTDKGRNAECPMSPQEVSEAIERAARMLEIMSIGHTTKGVDDMTFHNHAPSTDRHYTHAITKHRYFADDLFSRDTVDKCDEVLANCREVQKCGIANGNVYAEDVLMTELWEIVDAYKRGDTASAIEECYDSVAVLLRMVDVMRGEQKLGIEAAL